MTHLFNTFLLAAFLIIVGTSTTLLCSPISIGTLSGENSIKTWKDLRDKNIVKQDFDYSCGASSLATILNQFYGDSVTEQEILKRIDKKDASSFADLKHVAEELGYKAEGYSVNLSHLYALKIPALLYMNHKGNDHFSVLRGLNKHTVWLGDPSWGNAKINIHRFLTMWKTRKDKNLYGKMLVIFPKDSNLIYNKNKFFRKPKQSTLIYETIALNRF
jgi:predicted double-glycine peptidase